MALLHTAKSKAPDHLVLSPDFRSLATPEGLWPEKPKGPQLWSRPLHCQPGNACSRQGEETYTQALFLEEEDGTQWK